MDQNGLVYMINFVFTDRKTVEDLIKYGRQ